MSKKLAQAVASGNVVVLNKTQGEVSLMIKGQVHLVGSKQTLNLGALVDNAKDCMKIGGLKNMLQLGRLTLV